MLNCQACKCCPIFLFPRKNPARFLLVTAVFMTIIWLNGMGSLAQTSYWQHHNNRPNANTSTKTTSDEDSRCSYAITDAMLQRAEALRHSCQRSRTFSISCTRIATLTAHFDSSEPIYKDAIRTHLQHTIIHNNSLRVMCDAVVDGLWNKQAYLLSNLMLEMSKPPERRLHWLFWADPSLGLMYIALIKHQHYPLFLTK